MANITNVLLSVSSKKPKVTIHALNYEHAVEKNKEDISDKIEKTKVSALNVKSIIKFSLRNNST